MANQNHPGPTEKTFADAQAALDPILANAKFLGLLRGALNCGIFKVTTKPSTPDQISSALNLPEDLVIDLCYALDAHGVFQFENGRYCLEDHWAILTNPDSHRPLGGILDFNLVESRVLEHIGSLEDDYWEATPFDRLALAKGATIDPTSSRSPGILRSNLQKRLPEIHEVLEAGGHCLELGCGMGGGLLTLVRAYPKMTAVGIDLAADLLQEAQQTAVNFDLCDRITFHQGDASTFEVQQVFDVVRWSQFYFPMESRAGSLQVAFRALKSGGFLTAPLRIDASVLETNLHSEQGKKYTLGRAYLRSWGVPALSTQEVQEEMEKAGFISPLPIETGHNHTMRARHP